MGKSDHFCIIVDCGKTRRLASFHVTIEFHEFQLGIFNIYSKIYAHTAKASAMTRSVFRVPAPNTNHLLWRRGIRLLRRQHRELELVLSIPLSFLLHAAPPSQLVRAEEAPATAEAAAVT